MHYREHGGQCLEPVGIGDHHFACPQVALGIPEVPPELHALAQWDPRSGHIGQEGLH